MQIERARNVYQISALNSDSTAGVILTTPDGGTQPASASVLTSSSEWFRRRLSAVSFAPQPYISGTGETNHMTKWLDGPSGVVGDANITELNGGVVVGNGTFKGSLHIYGGASTDVFAGMGPDLISGPAFNYGYGGSSFGRSAGFFNVRPDASAVAPNPSLRFMTSNVERMMISNVGNVGIGMSNPSARLEVRAMTTGSAIYGVNQGTGIAVEGFSASGIGVKGFSLTGVGVEAFSQYGNYVEGRNTLGRMFHITNSGTYVAGSDFAEALPVVDRDQNEPGDVLIISEQIPGGVEKATRPYDTRVVGVFSTRPGLLGAEKDGTSRVDANDVPVAIVGIVPTKVSTENGPVQAGNLLTTSSTPGYAMKALPISVGGAKIYPTGTILGKALEPLNEGRGVIKVLVTLK